jgi:hypothetical protein
MGTPRFSAPHSSPLTPRCCCELRFFPLLTLGEKASASRGEGWTEGQVDVGWEMGCIALARCAHTRGQWGPGKN